LCLETLDYRKRGNRQKLSSPAVGGQAAANLRPIDMAPVLLASAAVMILRSLTEADRSPPRPLTKSSPLAGAFDSMWDA